MDFVPDSPLPFDDDGDLLSDDGCTHGGTAEGCSHGEIPESCTSSGEAAHCEHSAINLLGLGKTNPDRRDEELEDTYRLHRRFDRMGRLVGDDKMAQLMSSHVTVIGLGGVGSMVVESLVRSGIGHLTLVDFDRVCVTNSNRQLQAMRGTVGKRKAEVLGERVRAINPQARVDVVCRFYDAHSAEDILKDAGFVVDAIDNVTAKLHLLASCRSRGIPVVSCTGAAGRIDPTAVKFADLADTEGDRLAHIMRKHLRQRYNFPRKGPFGIPAVFSTEPQIEPVELHYDHGEGFRCVCPGGSNDLHSCDSRNIIYGTASWVTGTFGLVAASVVVRKILGML